ncbi:hypothetical protein AB0M43_06185 [Longispora sp. NPDC051575]|uniref:hypothetical protein n=1 Tax=Longispora sp. NPDC051575 TaxID=3154943 RepID=UPI003434BC0B
MSTRLGALVLLLVATLLSGCGGESAPAPAPDPARLLAAHVAGLAPDGRYRPPRAEESRAAGAAVELLLAGGTERGADQLASLGMPATRGTDPVTGRPFTVYASDARTERSWGLVLVDGSAPARWVVEVPHPAYDLRTEDLGLDLFRAVPGTVLLVAGAHRKAGGGAADVAHHEDSVFHALADAYARHGLAQLQLHGFADRNLPGTDAVVSTGQAVPGPGPLRVADQLDGAGLAVCRAWREQCGRLEGTSNVQGAAAAGYGAVFVHLEASWSVRSDPARRSTLARALVAAGLAAP